MLPFSEACERNRQPILEILRGVLVRQRYIVEIGAGTGQQAVYSANTLHIMSWPEVEVFFRGVGRILDVGGMLAVNALAAAQGLELHDDHAMPANNQLLTWVQNS